VYDSVEASKAAQRSGRMGQIKKHGLNWEV